MSYPSHPHEWDKPYDFKGTTYRECSGSDCGCHQQWVCALDRWSDTFETPSPRERAGQRTTEGRASSPR